MYKYNAQKGICQYFHCTKVLFLQKKRLERGETGKYGAAPPKNKAQKEGLCAVSVRHRVFIFSIVCL